MSDSFVGGVRDHDGRRGYVAAGPDIVAVDLATGSVLWRRRAPGRPIAATATRLLTLGRDGGNFVLRMLDAATGADAGRVSDFGMPDWGGEVGTEADAVQIDASEVPEGIHISWNVRRPYRGGAPPPAATMALARDVATGAVVIDPESGRATPAASGESHEATSVAPDLGPHAATTPDVVAMDRIDERLFVLKAERRAGQPTRIVLEARDAQSGSRIWETPLAEIEEARPRPLRK